MRSLGLGVTLAMLASAPLPAQAANPRFAPPKVKQAILGCWQLDDGARLVVSEVGRHSVRAHTTFAGKPRMGPSFMDDPRAPFIATDGTFEVSCQPRSQHGSFCRISPGTSGRLHVAVYALHHGDRAHGHLVRGIDALHCR